MLNQATPILRQVYECSPRRIILQLSAQWQLRINVRSRLIKAYSSNPHLRYLQGRPELRVIIVRTREESSDRLLTACDP